jgi:hypothetical protein
MEKNENFWDKRYKLDDESDDLLSSNLVGHGICRRADRQSPDGPFADCRQPGPPQHLGCGRHPDASKFAVESRRANAGCRCCLQHRKLRRRPSSHPGGRLHTVVSHRPFRSGFRAIYRQGCCNRDVASWIVWFECHIESQDGTQHPSAPWNRLWSHRPKPQRGLRMGSNFRPQAWP